MANFLATAVGLAFTLVVCLLVLRALLDPWIRIRRRSVTVAEKSGTVPSQKQHAAPLHTV